MDAARRPLINLGVGHFLKVFFFVGVSMGKPILFFSKPFSLNRERKKPTKGDVEGYQPNIMSLIPKGTVYNNLGPDRLAGQKALDSNYCREPII